MSKNLAWLLILFAAVNSTLGNLMLKKSSMSSAGFFAAVTNMWFVGGVAFYGVNVLFFAKALEILPVSVSYPVLAGVGFILLTVSANFVLGEKLVFNQLIGIFFILVGIFVLGRE